VSISIDAGRAAAIFSRSANAGPARYLKPLLRFATQNNLNKLSGAAAAPLADNSSPSARASESADPAAAARYEAVRRNCCNALEARSESAANVRARHTPDSNTAPSHRADIASSLSSRRNFVDRLRERNRIAAASPRTKPVQEPCKKRHETKLQKTTAPGNCGDCALRAIVCQ